MAEETLDEMINRYRNETYAYMRRGQLPSSQPESAFQDDAIQNFMKENPKEGRLKIQAFTAGGAIPIAGATVRVSRMIGDSPYVFYNVVTDEDGIANGMTLPAPPKALSESPESSAESWTGYDIEVSYPSYPTQRFSNIPIFEGIETIQPVNFLPAQAPEQPGQADS